METVTFDNGNYKIRELHLEEFGEVIVSTEALHEALLKEDSTYTSIKAERLDESIFYFVSNSQIELEENTLKQVILQNI